MNSFYGINLNQNVVLQQIGFAGKTGTPWERLFKISIGNIIITALGFVPGAWQCWSRSSSERAMPLRWSVLI